MKTEIKEFILEEHANVCSEMKQKIEERYPELFKSKLAPNKWYKHKNADNAILFLKDTSLSAHGFLKHNIGYGFNYKGRWTDIVNLMASTPNDLAPATDEEVKDALIAEAKRIGFIQGVKTNSLAFPNNTYNKGFVDLEHRNFEYYSGVLFAGGICIFQNGKWATIIEQEEKMISLNEVRERIQTIENELQSLKELLK